MSEISVYKCPVKNTTPLKSVSLFDIYSVIKSDKYKSVTDKLRSLESKAEKDLCKQTELDYATFSGTFKTRSNSLLIERSQYFCIDIDHIGNDIEIANTKSLLLQSHIPALIFVSPSGDGLKVIYKVNTTDGSHEDYYYAFEDYFKTEFNTKIDASCKDISRACFLCYDSECFISDNPDVLGKEFIGSHKTKLSVVITTEYEDSERPGDIYNNNPDSISEMKSLLQSIGWKQIDEHKWRRPDKEEGISATLGKVAPNVFYVFTSSAHPFEPMKPYTPFQVLGLIKYNGDFTMAAKSLAVATPKVNVNIPQIKKIEQSDIEKILLGSRIDTSRPIAKPPTILSIKEQQATSSRIVRLFTLGNFSCIIGKAKSRKTFLQSLLTAATLGNDSTGRFISELPETKRDVVYFDTEQSEYDCFNVISRIEKMSGNKVNLKGYSLRQYSPIERCQIIEYAFELWGKNIGLCIIDGVADLANAINDELEATRISTMFLRLTKVYNCHISTVIHQNKNDNFATGHLGSSIMKKAEILISVSKSKCENNISEITCDYNRGIDFEPFEMLINEEGIPEIRGQIKKKVKYEPTLSIESSATIQLTPNTSFDKSDEYEEQFNHEPNF